LQQALRNVTLLLGQSTQERGHVGEGERCDSQELLCTEVEVPAKEVCVDERSEEVVVVVLSPSFHEEKHCLSQVHIEIVMYETFDV
jgi:hypothetical protein